MPDDRRQEAPGPQGVRVVIDLRALQDPERAPQTAVYLEGLLGALEADPLEGESLSVLLAADRDDPTTPWPGLPVMQRRLLPPTRLLRSGALTVDPFVLRGASLGAGWRADRDGAAGTVYHAIGGSLPIASGVPVVAAVLDLAPWALPEAYQRGVASRFGQRVRGRLLKDTALVLVPGHAAAIEVRRLLHVRPGRLRVVPLAARPEFRPTAAAGSATEADRLGLGPRYAVYAGRYDARQDLPTLLDALARLAEQQPDPTPPEWPPRVCLVGATPDDRAALSRAAARAGVADAMAYAPSLPPDRLAALVAGARFVVQPVRSEAAGLTAIEALAAGVPVVASAVGVLPEIVGSAGILVEPGDAARLATALRAAWTDDELHATLVAAALERAAGARTWADVALETRQAWSDAVRGRA
ncbi:MAG TPA: glycosyltransferase [Candidatus Limnocylindrales bacterium]|nr:glycosyltransferase [Candidatus Limnocylindrales bacterium]